MCCAKSPRYFAVCGADRERSAAVLSAPRAPARRHGLWRAAASVGGKGQGLLLEGARRLPVDAKARQRWKELGDKELAARARLAAAQSPSPGDGVLSSTVEREPEGEPGEQEHVAVEH